MFTGLTRRDFAKNAAASAALLGLGDYAFLGRIPAVSAGETKLDPKRVRSDSGIDAAQLGVVSQVDGAHAAIA